jgi:hypothetical protein
MDILAALIGAAAALALGIGLGWWFSRLRKASAKTEITALEKLGASIYRGRLRKKNSP